MADSTENIDQHSNDFKPSTSTQLSFGNENPSPLRKNFEHSGQRKSKKPSGTNSVDSARWHSNLDDYDNGQNGEKAGDYGRNYVDKKSAGFRNLNDGGSRFVSQDYGNSRERSRFSKSSPAFRTIQATLSRDSKNVSCRNTSSSVGAASNSFNDRFDTPEITLDSPRTNYETSDKLINSSDVEFGGILPNGDDISNGEALFNSIDQVLQNYNRSNRSTRNITALIDCTMKKYVNDCHKWQMLIDDLILAYACEVGGIYVELAGQLFVHFISEPAFQKAAYVVFMKHIGILMAPANENSDDVEAQFTNLCELFGKLLISSWPHGFDSCAKECNTIIYVIVNAIHTWINVLDKAVKNNSTNPVEIVENCSKSVVSLCRATGRKLWLKWPDLVDQLYAILKFVIISNCGVSEIIKVDLLDLFVKLNEWPKPVNQSVNKVYTRNVFCQTDNELYSASDWQNSLLQTGPNDSETKNSTFDSLTFSAEESDKSNNVNFNSKLVDPRIFLTAPSK